MNNFFMILISIPVFTFGLMIGVFLGYTVIDKRTKSEIRRAIERSGGYSRGKVNSLADTRVEPRKSGNNKTVEIIVPELDTAGVVMESDIRKVSGELADLSPSGAAVLCSEFIPIGLVVKMTYIYGTPQFRMKEAETRNISITPRGLRIGFQFISPLQGISDK